MRTGLIKSYLETEDSKEITKILCTPGNICTHLSSMAKESSVDLNNQSLTKVTAYRGNFSKFKKLTKNIIY